jgi:hypothetical protein
LLEGRGVSVWIDRKSITGGTTWSGEIVEAIKRCAALVVVISEPAMQSRNVQQEIQLAWEHDRKILPLRLSPVELPSAVEYALAGRQWIDILDQADPVWLPHALRALAGLGLAPRAQHLPAGDPLMGSADSPEIPTDHHNLPAHINSFVGREQDIEECKAFL